MRGAGRRRRRGRARAARLPLICAASALAGALALGACDGPAPDGLPPAALAYIPTRADAVCAITRIVDGDTVVIRCRDSDGPVRLVGFDTPETHRPGCAEEARLGRQAKRVLQSALQRARVIAARSEGIDRYRRPLVRLALDGRDLAAIMVEAGVARPYHGGKRPDWCRLLG